MKFYNTANEKENIKEIIDWIKEAEKDDDYDMRSCGVRKWISKIGIELPFPWDRPLRFAWINNKVHIEEKRGHKYLMNGEIEWCDINDTVCYQPFNSVSKAVRFLLKGM